MKIFVTLQGAVLVTVVCCLRSSNASLTEGTQYESEDNSSLPSVRSSCFDYSRKTYWLNTLVGCISRERKMNHEANYDAVVLIKRNQSCNGSLFRTQVETTCTCQSSVSLVDLGQRTYPRYITSAICNSSLCRGYGTICQSIYYTTYVLRNKNAETNVWHYTQDEELNEELPAVAAVVDQKENSYTLPHNLRRKWKLDGIRIVATCLCMK